MNKAKLKSYAPAARRDFIQAVTDRAHFYGLSEQQIIPVEVSGDVAIIGGRPFPLKVTAQRRKLEERVKREGFNQVMETVAYTWFNRFLALRFMELHGYLEHGFRVLSNTGSSTVPEILDHAADLELIGLNKQMVVELKLDGSKDAELYRLLLVAQCNALHAAMPFLFEKIEDETELLLPDNLLHSDSLVRKLVTEIEEEDWQEVEIIGWLYQFYISEKKDQVIGKVVKSEDIPAATQLFTPNWIVKYMVQNSLGRKWLATYPDSPLKGKLEYYIEPAEQTDEVKAQLAAITPDSLDPEQLTLLDPACGSGHILVEAYDVFKEIYLERGYSIRDFPRLILEKNLFGLDIDDRAAQMAGFALLMKARKDDRRILQNDNPITLNVLAIQESSDFSIDNTCWGEHVDAIRDLVDIFCQGKTYGSLIHVPERLAAKLVQVEDATEHVLMGGNLYESQIAKELLPLLVQAKILARKYDCVVANPPYMGGGYFNTTLSRFVTCEYKEWSEDLYSAFIKMSLRIMNQNGIVSMITMSTWSFLPSYLDMRISLLKQYSIQSFIDNGRGIWGSDHGTVMFTLQNCKIDNYVGAVKSLTIGKGKVQQVDVIRKLYLGLTAKYRSQEVYTNSPSSVISAGVSDNFLSLMKQGRKLSDIGNVRQGIKTGDMNRFMRFWHEVAFENIFINCNSSTQSQLSDKKWYPCNKGGEFRKWYGNLDYVVNWKNDGEEIKNFKNAEGKIRSRPQNIQYFFRPGVTWSTVTMGKPSFRYSSAGRVFESGGSTIFFNTDNDLFLSIGVINSIIGEQAVSVLSPKVSLGEGAVSSIPIPQIDADKTQEIINNSIKLVDVFVAIEHESEASLEFISLPMWFNKNDISLSKYFTDCKKYYEDRLKNICLLEARNNSIVSEAINDEYVSCDEQPLEEFGVSSLSESTLSKSIISFCVGCMMGRFSLDQPGLVYANSNNFLFDQSKYQTFPADDDGIVPVMDMDWFPDDAASQIEEFLKVAWSPETLEENLKFVADSLSPKGNETPRETIRRYISTQFFKDHLQTYRKRPIYWLFSSGKQRAFECLVYLHRYNESTLSRMRNEYVTPLQGKFSAQVDYLSNEVNAASSTAERNRLQKQLDTLRKKQVELAAFDDLLRHYADQRISLDLDDGVKVNYGKFGNLLVEVKAVTGGGE